MTPQGWTDDRVAALKQLWLCGHSAAQAAKQLGVSRNAVIGKLHRLGLTGVRAAASRSRRVAASTPPPQRPVRRGAAAPVSGEPGLVRDSTGLRRHVCKWPIGDPQAADFSFCGRRAHGNGPYCPEHHRLAHRRTRAQPLDRDPILRRLLAA